MYWYSTVLPFPHGHAKQNVRKLESVWIPGILLYNVAIIMLSFTQQMLFIKHSWDSLELSWCSESQCNWIPDLCSHGYNKSVDYFLAKIPECTTRDKLIIKYLLLCLLRSQWNNCRGYILICMICLMSSLRYLVLVTIIWRFYWRLFGKFGWSSIYILILW